MINAPNDLKHLMPLLRELDDLCRKNISADQRVQIEMLMAACQRFQLRWGDEEVSTANRRVDWLQPTSSQNVQQDAHSAPELASELSDPESPYYRKGLGEAAAVCIEIHDRAMHTDEIWSVLHKVGFKTAHEFPAHAIYDALRKKMKRDRDVVKVDAGSWGLAKWYSEAQIAQFKSAHRGERTSEGMALAKERGSHIGNRRKFTDEVRAEVIKRVKSGEPVTRIAQTLELSAACIRGNFKKGELKALREQGKREQAEARVIRPDFRSSRQMSGEN